MRVAEVGRASRRRFEAFWLASEQSVNIDAARILLAASALWVVLSRLDLPSLLLLPQELWQTVPLERRLRFLLIFPVAIERFFWIGLHVVLVMALLGFKRRWSCIASGLLLYHFAPLETIIWTPNPYLRGLTIPCLGLLLIGFAEPRVRSVDRSQVGGWALRLTQMIFCSIYFFAGYAKLFWSGIAWANPQNMRLYLLSIDQFLALHTPAARWIADSPSLSLAIGISGMAFELIFPVVMISRRARWVVIPAAILFHIGNSMLFHIFFHNIAVLLIFVNWQWVLDSCRALRIPLPSAVRTTREGS